MIASWLGGALKSLFGASSSTENWATAKNLMEQSFGEMRIDNPQSGKIHAFFVKQTLAGDESRYASDRYRRPTVWLDMDEAVGTGKDGPSAVLNLWKNLTELEPHHTILQMDKTIYKGCQPRTLYNSWKFSNGSFEGCGQVLADQPPARPATIEKFLEEESLLRVRTRLESALFAEGPKGSGN